MSKWYKASEIERLKNLTPRDGVTGLPDNHVITVSERVISVDNTNLVQNNIATDTFTLVLDAEWDGITPVVIFTNDLGDYQVPYENAPTKIPAAAMAGIGSVEVSVFGLDSTGAVRVVTKAAPNTMNVVKSGKFVGEVSSDDASLLGQILAAAEAANKAAANANATVIKSAVATTLNPGEPATANLADNVLTIGVPKGKKGEKGDPGQNGTDGVTPFAHATVTTLEPGVPATVAIEENTLKLGIPKGEKGDKGSVGGKGETGDKGDPGTAATIAVGSVTGLDAGASPTVVNSGTTTAARFDFGIPKGDKGDTGAPGHTPQRGVDYWTAEDVKAVVEDAKAQAVAELAEIGNVPKRTVTDLVVHGEDAYAQKPIEVRVKGRTVKNLWPSINMSTASITASTDDTGLITITGTAAGNSEYLSKRITGVVPGRTVTLLISKAIGGNTGLHHVSLEFKDSSGTQIPEYGWVGIVAPTTTTATATIPEGTASVTCGFKTMQNGGVNWTGRVMLVEGSEVPDCFTPPASITSVQTGNLVTTGKNLISLSGSDYSGTGTVNGQIIEAGPFAAGSNHKGLYITMANPITLPAGDYVFSANPAIPNESQLYIIFDDNSRVTIGALSASSKFSLPFKRKLLYVNFQTLSNTTHEISWRGGVQLELGSTATAYEPPNITTTPLPEVELRSLPNGACDELVIGADGACEAERKTGVIVLDGSDDEIYRAESNPAKNGVIRVWLDKDTGLCASVSDGAVSNLYPNVNTWEASGFSVSIKNTGNIFFNDVNCQTPDSLRQKLQATPMTIVGVLRESTTEPQSPVTPPALPAPTFNQYHDADVPSDTSTTYARDINIVIDNLAKQINTTQATISVDKASTIE